MYVWKCQWSFQGYWCSVLPSAASWGSKEDKTLETHFWVSLEFARCPHSMLAHLEMDQAAAFLANYLVADLRSSILTALSKNSVTKRCKFLFFDFLHWKSYLPLSFVSVQTTLSPRLTSIASASERLPKRYSSVLKWGNLDSPAYPLLLASWLAHSHLLSKSIHPHSLGSFNSLSPCTPVKLIFHFVSVCIF